MSKTLGEHELADALRGVIGTDAGRAVAATLAALREHLQAPSRPLSRLYDALGLFPDRTQRERAAARDDRVAAAGRLAAELADLLADAEVSADLVIGLAGVRGFRRRIEGVEVAEALAADRVQVRDIEGHLRELACAAELVGAFGLRPPRRPGPPEDRIRLHVVFAATSALRRAGVRIGTGERSPAVLALEVVLRWYPMRGDARQLLRNLKKSAAWGMR